MILKTGAFVQDRYEILGKIGSGGMSDVYKARCHKLNRLVAVKVLKEEYCLDEDFVDRFRMEAQSAASLSHPNIVGVYDVIDSGSLHCIVMELVEGITLKTYIKRKQRLDARKAIGISLQVAQGIEAAHEQGLIHRDIKPQNMLISVDGTVKVADFGIARAVSSQSVNPAVMGSVHYISPEQARGEQIDARSDIYSLGVTIYEMATGHVPFGGDTPVAIALAHIENAVVPPSVYVPDLPKGFESIIMRCIMKDPQDRYPSVKPLIEDLKRVLVEVRDVDLGGAAEERAASSAGAEDDFGDTVTVDHKKINAAVNANRASGKTDADARKRTSGGQVLQEIKNTRETKEKSSAGDRIFSALGILAALLAVGVMVAAFAFVGRYISGHDYQLHSQEGEVLADADSDTTVVMPDLYDISEESAQEKLKECSLNMKCSYEFSDSVGKGYVLRQLPKAGETVDRWSNVEVVISNGSDSISVDELGLYGMDVDMARRLLESLGLSAAVEWQESSIAEKGQIVAYSPDRAKPGDSIRIIASSGASDEDKELVEIPNIVGLDVDSAVRLLETAGFVPGDAGEIYSDDVKEGEIVSYDMVDGGMAAPGTVIDYEVCIGSVSDADAGERVTNQRYIASINEVYDLSPLIGPGAGTSNLTVLIRLHQKTGSEDIYKILTPAKTISADVLLPVNFTAIESQNGTDWGEVEVVNAQTEKVLKTYELTFFPMD